MNTYRHRLARIDDLPDIVAIYNSTIASRQVTADTEPVSVAARRAWFDEHAGPTRPLWVCEQDGRIAGWLSFSNFYGRPAYAGTAEVSIYLHEDWRGKGLGGYFLAQALDHAPRIGVHTVLGFVFAQNLPSLRLFERFGFSAWAHLPRVARLDETECDLIILGKRVD